MALVGTPAFIKSAAALVVLVVLILFCAMCTYEIKAVEGRNISDESGTRCLADNTGRNCNFFLLPMPC